MNSSSSQEKIWEQSPLSRGNSQAHDPRSNNQVNNVGTGITATLTRNFFPDSFPKWEAYLGEFGVFFWAPQKVIGQGWKYIQWGTKATQTFIDYTVGDTMILTIPDQFKVYECRIGDLRVRMQISSNFPVHWHVDKFIDVGEYVEFENRHNALLARSMAKDMVFMFRWLFMSSAFGTCLPTDEYRKLLLRTLAIPQDAGQIADLAVYSPMTKHMLAHKDVYLALSDEMNKKISNKWVFDCHDVIHNTEGTQFNILNPWNKTGLNVDAWRRLKNCLTCNPAGNQDTVSMPRGVQEPSGIGERLSREQCLLAFETVLVELLERSTRPSHLWWQGNCGNIHGRPIEEVWKDSNYPEVKDRYPANKGTTIMDKPMSQRPFLEVVCDKANKVLVMSRADYRDFVYFTGRRGVFGNQQVARVNFDRVADLTGTIIPIDDMIPGHAVILDKRMLVAIPHLKYTGVDTLAQRLATVKTMHDWFYLGMFDQFVGIRLQMTSFTGNAIDMNNIFLQAKDIKLITAQ